MRARPLPMGTDEKLFLALHRGYIDGPRKPPPWEQFDPSGLSGVKHEQVRVAWAARAEAEYRSMVVFSELIARFPEVGMPLEISCAASRLLHDEARHTEYCARIAELLGGMREDANLDSRDLRLVSDRLPAKLFIARWVASMFCVGETASVGLLQELLSQATDPCVRKVLDTLLRDESLHDRFGWALARVVFPTLSEDEREWLAADLAFSFAHYEWINAGCMRVDGGALPEVPPEEKPNLGVVSREAFARGFYQRLDKAILPRFVELGIPAYEAWALRHEARARLKGPPSPP